MYGDVEDYEVAFRDTLNDDGLWRIVTNAYPYKTPQQMGVNNEDEAYIATKQAIYRYLAGEDETYYGGGGIGTAGARVYNAIANLLDIGYYGTDTIINATANISQDKSLDFDNKNTNYYSATYSVSSNTAYQYYTVLLDTDKSGILVTDLNNNIKNKFATGEKFKVLIPKSIVETNFSIGINAYLSCETKPVIYGEAYDPNLQDYLITLDPYEDVSTDTTLTVKKLTENGKIIVYKVDKDTKKAIKGVTFELYKGDKKIATATTNADGQVTFPKLDEGTYIVKETATNSNYVLNKNTKTVEVPFNATKEVTIENEHKKGKLKVYKLDKDNQKITLKDVVFDLYSKEFNKIVGTYTTNNKGEILIEGLRTGDYILKEKSTNKWYNMSEDVNVKIKYEETTEVAIFNELKKGQIKVIKVNADEPNILLEGVKFNVLDKDGNVLETITTNSKGEATSSRIPIRYEKIYLQEIKTDNNYVLNNNLIEFTLKENQVITKTVENQVKKGKIQILKKDADNNKIGVEGATFEVINEQKGIVEDTITTDKNGIATSKDLSVLYTYKLKEISTNKKYIFEEKQITDISVEHNKVLKFEVTNMLKKGQVKIIKKDLDNNNIYLEGVVFEILDDKGNVVDTITTDKRGEAVSKMLPCIDEVYIIREKSTKLEYVLAKKIQTVTLQQDKVKSMEIFNEKKKGILQITKVDSKDHSKKLEGAIFAVYNENNELLYGIATDKNGVAKTGELPYGNYYIKEVATGSKYYLLNDEVYNFKIRNDGEVIEKTYTNEPVEIKVDVKKKGIIETKPNKVVDYTFSDISNNSNTDLDMFKWYDYIPTSSVRLESMTTGTWNQNLKYDVYYKTNKNSDYALFREDLNTTENYNLNFKDIELDENEYITEICFNFGEVNIGFKEVEKPTMQCRVLSNVADGQTFTNKTTVEGVFGELTSKASDKWTTIVHVPAEPTPVLPNTGK